MTASGPTPAGSHFALGPVRIRRDSLGGRILALIIGTIGTATEYRLLGLAAEGAFFCVLSLPPVIFGLAGSVGFFVQRLNVIEIEQLRDQILQLASGFLTADVITEVLAPTLDEVLGGGRADVISIGFLLALWSGSRAANVFIDTISIVYGQAQQRSILRTRLLSIVIYVALLLLGAIMLPLVLLGPSLLSSLLPGRIDGLSVLYWPVVVLGTVCVLATVFHRIVPERVRWRADLPGAALTMIIWLGGSYLLRLLIGLTVDSTSIYGPLAAPIALLLWLYVIAAALLLGAALNATAERVWPQISARKVPPPPPLDPAEEAQRRVPHRP